jgi:hypothetical protein
VLGLARTTSRYAPRGRRGAASGRSPLILRRLIMIRAGSGILVRSWSADSGGRGNTVCQ